MGRCVCDPFVLSIGISRTVVHVSATCRTLSVNIFLCSCPTAVIAMLYFFFIGWEWDFSFGQTTKQIFLKVGNCYKYGGIWLLI